METRSIPGVAAFPVALALLLTAPSQADDEIFAISEIDAVGRVVSANFADFNGDDRTDLMVATLNGIPPQETRSIRVHLQDATGMYSREPSHTVPIPPWSAVYDIADINDKPGDELVLLRPDGVTVLSLADESGDQWHLPVAGPSTVAAGDDERGFDPFKLVYFELTDEPLILIPQIGELSIMTTDGSIAGRINAGRRANYYVVKDEDVVSVESDIQLYFDVPKIAVGDVDGDGIADIVAATRHEIRVFPGQADGQFEREPARTHALGMIDSRDHSRGSGSVITTLRDIDDDGLLDLIISHVEGTFSDTVTTTYIHRNRNGEWDLQQPDDEFVSEGSYSSDVLFDIDSDDVYELVRIQFRFSVLEIVEMLLTRQIDAMIAIHRLQEDGRYDDDPWSRRKVSTGISFETFRPKGFMPRAGLDLNADGLMDFVTSDNGKGIEVYLGDDDGPFGRRSALQKMNTTGVIRFADFNDDDLPDFVLYDTQVFDTAIKVGRNLGTLEGSP